MNEEREAKSETGRGKREEGRGKGIGHRIRG